ncbi:MAG: TraR/DksA family transcriptional regulator [Planctomycetes bacterium]|nr:TraR/DksA family transcriptional regulator [Planctomycetota bacterium]
MEEKLSELLKREEEIEGALCDPRSADWEENAVESEGDEVLTSVGEVTQQEIHEIRLALKQIEAGQYGKCVSCGKSIGKERLLAIPSTTKCIRCA